MLIDNLWYNAVAQLLTLYTNVQKFGVNKFFFFLKEGRKEFSYAEKRVHLFDLEYSNAII